MRKLGWYADSWTELAMNIGTWAMVFALGMLAQRANAPWEPLMILAIGAVIGMGAQLAWAGQKYGVIGALPDD